MKRTKSWLRTLAVGAVLASTGCAVVKSYSVTSSYAESDQKKVKRLLVLTAPFPAGQEPVAKMWSALARKYVNLHRDFLVKADQAQAASPDPHSLCGEGLEGVLYLKPTEVKQEGTSVHAGVEAQLLRCSDGGQVWSAKAAGSWPTDDKNLSGDTQSMADKFGPAVAAYYPASFYLLRAALDTLPKPVLSDEEQNEKIELGD